MRLLLHIILLLTVLQSNAQDSRRVNFALINYDLTGKKLIFDDQELFLSTLLSFGDKNIVFEEVFKRLLQSPDFSTEDSLIKIWMFDYEPQDSITLLKFPNVVKDWRETIIHFIRVTYMAKSYQDKISLSEAYLNIHQDRPEKFPHIPEENAKDGYTTMYLIEKYYQFNKWALEYPEEFEYFLELARSQTKTHFGTDSDKDIVRFFDLIKKDAIETNSINEQNIPTPLKFVITYYESQKIRNLKHAEECSEEGIENFLTKAYDLIYFETIPETTLTKLSSYVKENEVYDPELIYLALLLSKYE